MPVDPLVSLLVGAFGAALLGLFGAWIQSRREHVKWLREKRYDAHLAFLVLTDRHTTNAKLHQGPKTDKAIAVALEALNETVSAISLLGPESLLDEARALRGAAADFIATEQEPTGYAEVRAAYIIASRRSLRVSNRG
jgi:hypothetical protein